MPPEGVVHALHRIHAALVPEGLLVDTQPVSPRPPVEVGGVEVGALDMRQWRDHIALIDGLTEHVVRAGLFTLETEREMTVTDVHDSGRACVADVRDWKGTRVDDALAARLEAARGPARVHQTIRLRAYRAVPA